MKEEKKILAKAILSFWAFVFIIGITILFIMSLEARSVILALLLIMIFSGSIAWAIVELGYKRAGKHRPTKSKEK